MSMHYYKLVIIPLKTKIKPVCLLFPTDADLNIAQTAWGDSGVYYCSVVSSQDLSGNGEDYTELIVLGKLHSLALCGPHSDTHTLYTDNLLLLFSQFVCFFHFPLPTLTHLIPLKVFN